MIFYSFSVFFLIQDQSAEKKGAISYLSLLDSILNLKSYIRGEKSYIWNGWDGEAGLIIN